MLRITNEATWLKASEATSASSEAPVLFASPASAVCGASAPASQARWKSTFPATLSTICFGLSGLFYRVIEIP